MCPTQAPSSPHINVSLLNSDKMNALAGKNMSFRAAGNARSGVVCRAAPKTASKIDTNRWKALNVTKMNLIDSQGGRTTRNIDGAIYDITYDAGSDAVVVVDKSKGLKYPAIVGDDNRVRIDLEKGESYAVGLAMEPLQQVSNCFAANRE